ncbi:hypothetical protein KO489_09830 [Reinekea forsetii]|nr:hypothetical protein [Reinekea forsetii]
MKLVKTLGMISSASILVACGGGSGSGGDVSDAVSIALTGSAALPNQMALVTPSDDSERSLQRSLGQREVYNTSNYAGSSDYAKSHQNLYVWLDAVEPISFIDDFLCFTGQTKPLAMLGEGDYVAWADAGRCFDENDGSDQQQGSGSSDQVPSYVTIVANSSQNSATDPLVLNAWIEDYSGQSGEGGGPDAIKLLGTVSKTPTDDNPFGVFTLTYGLLPNLNSTQSDSTGYGEVTSSETSDGGASFTLYQLDSRQEQSQTVECTTTASVDYNDATEEGLARTARQCYIENTNTLIADHSGAFALAVNDTYVHMAKASTTAGLSSPDEETCLLRNEFTEVAWNYGLFNKSTGAEVAINSGMQLKVDADGDGSGNDANGFESWGHIGYHGSWREDGQAFANNENVERATWDGSTGEQYTVKVAPGRLVKNTVESVNLSALAGVSFNTHIYEGDTHLLASATDFNGDLDETDSLELVIEVNGTNDGFEVVGIQDGWGDSGPQITNVSPAVAINLNADRMLYLWSNQLGGNVKYKSNSSSLKLFARSYVNGSETGSGELFDSTASADLVCVERCLKADVSKADLAGDWDAVFDTDAQTVVNYDFTQSGLTLVSNGGTNAIGYASDVTSSDVESSQNWQWGLETGPMVPAGSGITTAQGFYNALENNTLTEFYHWETGMNAWQQQVVLVDQNSEAVAFDQPIAFKYTHEQANDRNNSSAHNGAVFFLEYGGKGQLHGLPWEGSENGWNPILSLADGTIMGGNDQYVIKALDVEQKMATTALSNCSALPLTEPSQAVPTSIAQAVFNIGAMPNVGDQPPAVIDGEVVE